MKKIVLFFVLSAFACAASEGYKPETPKDVRPVKPDHAAIADATPIHGGHGESTEPEIKAGDIKLIADEKDLDFSAIEQIAIQGSGRKQPLHTYVMREIEQLYGRPLFAGTPYLKDANGRKIEAMDVFLSMWFQTREWQRIPIILISYGPLKKVLDLPMEEKYFSVETLRLSKSLRTIVDTARTKRHTEKEKDITDIEKEAELVVERFNILFGLMSGDETLNIVPMTPNPPKDKGDWISLKKLGDPSSNDPYTPEQIAGLHDKFIALQQAYKKRDADAFTKTSTEFRDAMAALNPAVYPSIEKLDREIGYTRARPFGRAWVFYLCAVILGALTLKVKSRAVVGAVVALFVTGLAFHVYGFALRCMIAGRPPVSNMYESVVWVGFGAVFFSAIFELIYRRRYFMLCGAGAASMCLILMDLLPVFTGNPSMPGFKSDIEPLQPVLRNNFWLTVHVLTITLSYAAFMLTWVLGHVTLFKHLREPGAKEEQNELHRFVYRAMQVGVLLLACGTILGGVWAYYSWGRFWGWDPKETWAFIALMCYIVALHGRFVGWWGQFGLSVAAVVCFQAIVMAWYGVNFVLGSGMHAYGSGAGGQVPIMVAISLDALFVGATIWRKIDHDGKS